MGMAGPGGGVLKQRFSRLNVFAYAPTTMGRGFCFKVFSFAQCVSQSDFYRVVVHTEALVADLFPIPGRSFAARDLDAR
jgi:hypothetical protein